VCYPGLMSVAVHVSGYDTERGWWAKVKNASLGGACVLSPRRVPQGTRLLFELPAGEVGQARETVLMRVLHVAEDDFCDWLMDCEFVRRLSEEELRTLRLPPPL
jgi:PilZ domain